MEERIYRKNRLIENLGWIKEKKLALYVKDVDFGEILEEFSEYQIECLVDNDNAGRYIRGYYVVTLAQMFDLGIEYLVMITHPKKTEIEYERISEKCRANHVKIYNAYGVDMFLLHANMVKKHIEYPKLWEMDIKKSIDVHEVISFDIDNTVFTPIYMNSVDFFSDLEKRFLEAGCFIEDFTERILNLREVNSCKSLKQFIESLAEEDVLPAESVGKIWEALFDKIKKTFFPRNAVIDALQYSISAGKRVYLIADMPEYMLPREIWERLLKIYGVTGYNSIYCSSDYGYGKCDGLYRMMQEECGLTTYLHIGDDCETDIMVPQFYGIDTFLIKSPMEVYRKLDPISSIPLENKYVRVLVEKYIIAVYNDEYLMNKAEQKRCEMREFAVQLENKIRLYQNCNEPIVYEPILFDVIEEKIDIEDYPKLVFKEYTKPQVSIIIPVYNQFGYTYNCLRAVLAHTDQVEYEVIIADDCSTDQVKELEKVVLGAKILHNQENLRFLLNCNNAASYAKGEFILFLNNDTQVQPEWLSSLVELMKRYKDAGMAGSKLVYPEGYLQEAGGILWKDGSAWNYGHLKDPEDAEYSYVKEVDYISGAAIMIRASLWKEIGGFDKLFAPAYYEDTDLAFEVRKHGYKVLFQPKSIVVHFEGVSNGNDTLSGLKSYQVVNQKKFYRKWKEVLKREHFANGKDVYLAKDRGQRKKQIIVIDHYVPNFDKDAGGRCTFMYIKAFLNLGMKVTFIGDNFAKPEPYTTVLTQLGVEVLYGNYYYNNWEKWLKENLRYFDYIYLQRPHISIKYMDIMKKYGRGKIFYFAHDLHHVRFYRDYQITGNKESLLESEKWKEIEMDLFEKTDVGHVVGTYEQQVIQEVFPDKPIRNIPLYIYDEMPEKIEKDFSRRKDILFVGGFNHLPNVDAVLWFAKKIYPEILKKYPDLVWHIVGSNATEEILKLESDNIVLEGFLSDEELGSLYRTCRMVVVPLRYGAGVKGKIVEAAYYQIPTITTSIGGEGLDSSVGAFSMEDDADKMSALIIKLYCDFDGLRKMSDAGMEFIQKYFTSQAAEQVLLEDMNIE